MFNVDALKERLASFGYEAGENDEFPIAFCIDKVRNTIKNETNQKDVPEELEQIAVDMAAGEFLLTQKTFAPDKLENIDLSATVTKLEEGDTAVTFGNGEGSMTPEQRLNACINHLLTYGKAEFSKYRRLTW